MNTFRRLSIVASFSVLVLVLAAASASAHPVPASRPPTHRAIPPRTMKPLAVASSSTLISGTAVSGTGRWANASIGVYRWNGTAGVWQGYSTTTNSAGNYSLYVPSGYYYYVLGEKSNACSYSGGQILWGTSVWFAANGGKVNAQVTENSVTYYGTGC